MEGVCCPTIPKVWHEDCYRMHQTRLQGIPCSIKVLATRNEHLICPSLARRKGSYNYNSIRRWNLIPVHANGAAEFPTLTEQQTMSRDPLPSSQEKTMVTPGMPEAADRGPAQVSKKPDIEKESALKGIFPAGLHRPEVRLPGLVMMVQVLDVLGSSTNGFLDKLDSAIAAGFTMVVLEAGGSDGDDESSSGARLYEAARLLKATLRGRVELLVADRVDITAAAGVSGVLLSDDSLPVVVARSMLQNVSPQAQVLPLVGRRVSTAEMALLATASEGADFLILQGLGRSDAKTMIDKIKEKISIPIFIHQSGGLENCEEDYPLLKEGANGLTFNSMDLRNIPLKDVHGLVSSLLGVMSSIFNRRSSSVSRSSSSADLEQPDIGITTNFITHESSPLDLEFKAILEEERSLLTSMINLLKEASPEMEEVSLLVDAVVQLDDPFLLMVVGEFNSGKSSVINALLGKRYLPEGVLPTTNEIALLKYASGGSNDKERSERHPDGHFMYYLPAELLKEINLVDTPGTNVILKRQQRLTEEFVPRADLVLFVLSADRPFTESEMEFVKYIMQWDKRVVFLLNKSDIFSDEKELAEVVKFVKDNVQQVLSVEQATIYAVSARRAFQAKDEVGIDNGNLAAEKLLENRSWNLSGFKDFEKFIADFLGGSSDAGAERRRLKLATPLGIALTLLEACNMQVIEQAKKANADLEFLKDMLLQVDTHQKVMEKMSNTEREQLSALINEAKGRAERFVDSILRLSNVDAAASYLLGGDRQGILPVEGSFDAQVMGSTQNDLQSIIERHYKKLAEFRAEKLAHYREFLRTKWPDLEEYRRGKDTNVSMQVELKSQSLAVLEGFDTQAAKIVLEKELKDVMFTTFGGLGTAGLSASVLTSILPSTVEDLIALVVCSAGGFVGVWSFPNRKEKVKRKVAKVADSFAKQLDDAISSESGQSVDELRQDISELIEPYLQAAETEVRRVDGLREGISQAKSKIERLRLQVQNLGVP
ncbi:hypothetical protein KP509_22G005900 [Ceratopteris richardii]|uniref:G domain-containing protein n=1 Tax=Ceratopteris richardii TaxID=49495 RepID=A0A8T2S517_CERRI|nr:hypothetical protein KP509_22G005900 [Ceratopteris richardii]